MEKNKVLLVTSGFPFGNTERGFLSTEFRHLTEAFEVYVLSVGSKEPLLYGFPEDVGLERYAYPALAQTPGGVFGIIGSLFHHQVIGEMIRSVRKTPLPNALARCKQILAYWCNARSILQRMEQLHQTHRFDLIYTYWCTEATLAAGLMKKRDPRLRVITRFHGHDLFMQRKQTCWQPFRKLIGSLVDRLVFACAEGQRYFLDTWGEAFRGKSELRYLGSAPVSMPPKAPSGTLRLLSCSNLIPLKRVERIIDAIARIPGDVPVRWEHFGDGPERAGLEALARERLGGHISWVFHGHVPNQEISGRYRALDPDLFLTTSSTEGGVPVSLQEAFAMGIPAVGTDVGGIPDLILDGKTGYLLNADPDGDEVCRAILKFRDASPEEKAALSRNALTLWREKFDAERNSLEFMEDLHRLLSH